MAFEAAVLLLIIFQCCIFVTFLIIEPNRRTLANRFLAALLTVLAAHMSLNLLGPMYEQWVNDTGSVDFRRSLAFAYGPLFYFYLKALIIRGFKVVGMVWLHLVAPVAVCGMSFVYDIPVGVMAPAIFISVGLYLGSGIMLVRYYHRVLFQHYSQADSVMLRWVYITVSLLLIVFVLDVSQFFTSSSLISEMVFLTLLVFVSAFVFQAMKHPLTFAGISGREEDLSDVIPASFDIDVQEKLTQLMREQQPYLDANLTLSDLASQVNLSARELSRFINNQIGCNFPEYINGFRIEEAKRRLKEERETVLETLYAVGFNSKSSFNTLFKRKTGLTPSQFKEQEKSGA